MAGQAPDNNADEAGRGTPNKEVAHSLPGEASQRAGGGARDAEVASFLDCFYGNDAQSGEVRKLPTCRACSTNHNASKFWRHFDSFFPYTYISYLPHAAPGFDPVLGPL
jgi:hypothetical protein